MHSSEIPGPSAGSSLRQHVCSLPESVAALRDAIEADAPLQQQFVNRHILTLKHFDASLLRQLFHLAARYELGDYPAGILEGKILGTLYFNATREHTFLSAASAWKKLGGEVLDFDQYIDEMSLQRYLTAELAEIINSYTDIMALRLPDRETLELNLGYFTVPLINAGNGEDHHPLMAMSDLYTIFKWRPDLLSEESINGNRLQIVINGNPAQTRAIRSFLYGIAQFPWAVERIVITGRNAYPLDEEQRSYLLNAGLHIEYAYMLYPKESAMGALRKILPATDIAYFHTPYAANTARMNLVDAYSSLKKDALVLNPQIQNEIAAVLMKDSPHNCHCAQLRGTLYVKMALFALIFGRASTTA
jgi:aspartate carbamoyltransferase catalytic subunit